MKSFIKIVFGNLVAFALIGVLMLLFFSAFVTSLFMQTDEPWIEQGSVLVFDLSANVTDSPPRDDVWRIVEESLGSSSAPVYSLRAVTQAIRSAGTDSRVSALFLRGNFIPEGYGSGFAALRELREALLDFRESGKPLVAYVEAPTVRDYYVASAADQVLMNPYGMVGLSGLASQQIFIAGALERYGVGVQVTRVGQYKSAIEMFTEQQMSEPNRIQTEALLQDLWGEILEAISQSRGVSVADLQQLADSRGYIGAETALQRGLVDGVGYLDEVLGEVRSVVGLEGDEQFPQIGMSAYMGTAGDGSRERAKSRSTIAIVYVEGDIIDGESVTGSVGGDRFAREIRRFRQDPAVRALVVRVNSPGGSVTAAETIQREVALAAEQMPVIVSFGSFAASGGYWIATGADYIFSQPNTITGSIGVFGIFPNFQELAQRHGITFESVRTAQYADVFSLTRPKTEAEMELVQELVDEIYTDFLERVATGRQMPIEQVAQLAEGRVWSGQEALRLGLVDEIGGLREAVIYAAEAAGLDRWSVREFPRSADFAEVLAEMFEPDSGPLIGRDPFQQLALDLRSNYQNLQMLNDPRGIYARLPFSLRIE